MKIGGKLIIVKTHKIDSLNTQDVPRDDNFLTTASFLSSSSSSFKKISYILKASCETKEVFQKPTNSSDAAMHRSEDNSSRFESVYNRGGFWA